MCINLEIKNEKGSVMSYYQEKTSQLLTYKRIY